MRPKKCLTLCSTTGPGLQIVGLAMNRCLCTWVVRFVAALLSALPAVASGHGPVFGLTTPTNAKGGWAFDFATMGRVGSGDTSSMARAMLTYGITEDVQVSFSAPGVFSFASIPTARIAGMMPTSPDFEGVGAWRFYRRGASVGTRFESTAYGGLLVPGPQRSPGLTGSLKRAPGMFTAVATGMASRVHYFWGGIGNTHYAERGGDQRPNIFNYTLVYGYRPPAGRKDYPHIDWRLFAEMTGENTGKVRKAGMAVPSTGGNQIFLGPTALVIYRNYAIEGGVQVPVFRDAGPRFQRERLRFAINFSYFF